jgi:hypothetical protein
MVKVHVTIDTNTETGSTALGTPECVRSISGVPAL